MNFFRFHKLQTVRRLERVIHEIKRSPENSVIREFDNLWGKLQEFLAEEREDVNARSIEQSLRSPKKGGKPKANTPAVPAKASPATPSVAAAVGSPECNEEVKGKTRKADVGSGKGKDSMHIPANAGWLCSWR